MPYLVPSNIAVVQIRETILEINIEPGDRKSTQSWHRTNTVSVQIVELSKQLAQS